MPNIYGIKIFALADVTVYYTCNLEIYVGEQPDGPYRKSTLPNAIVERLVNVTFDNWFTSVTLVQSLLKKKLPVVGTIRKNKRNLPLEFLTHKGRQLKSSIFGFRENCTLLSYVLKKQKCVLLIFSMQHEDNIDLADTLDQLC
ncbi:hypothetical protein HUJ04_011682 [Dendroctonus ponderosae]|nr:hypothetical protein HUJ04_011682 [Dendroctonus ponderosae]